MEGRIKGKYIYESFISSGYNRNPTWVDMDVPNLPRPLGLDKEYYMELWHSR